jgi:integrase
MLSVDQKLDARRALEVLEGSGLSLESAARKAVEGAPTAESRMVVDVAVAAFLRAKRAAGLRESTRAWYARELGLMAGAFPRRTLDTLTRSELRGYIDGRVPGVRPAVWRCVRALFRWARRQEPPLLAADPTIAMHYAAARREERIEVLTVDQASRVLAACGPYRAAMAVALFAGLRPWEIAGAGKPALQWSHLLLEERVLRVPAEIAKTRVHRVLEGLPETLWRWLEAEKVREGPVCPARFLQACRRGKEALGWALWPQDIARHTFASYATAFLGDAGQVALWLGHEGDQRLLHRHYRGLVTQAAAKAFFALRPG